MVTYRYLSAIKEQLTVLTELASKNWPVSVAGKSDIINYLRMLCMLYVLWYLLLLYNYDIEI